MNETESVHPLKKVSRRPRVVSRVSGARTLIVQARGRLPWGCLIISYNFNIPFTDAQHREDGLSHQTKSKQSKEKRSKRLGTCDAENRGRLGRGADQGLGG